MSEDFGNVGGVLWYFSDFIVSETTEENHDKVLIKVFNRARELNTKCNKDKFQFKQNVIRYVGHKGIYDGMRLDKKYIEAVVKLKHLKNKKKLLKTLTLVE